MTTPCNGTNHDVRLDHLASPVKNRYFHGMLLTDEVFHNEQRYLDSKRWLINRLALGRGVLSGLDFDVADSGRDATPSRGAVPGGKARLLPGVALDGYGREIITPDQEGENLVDLMAGDGKRWWSAAKDQINFLIALGLDENFQQPIALELQIALAPEPTDLAPVKAGHCSNDCEPSKTRERFKARVVRRPAPDLEPRWPEPDPKTRWPNGRVPGEEMTRALGLPVADNAEPAWPRGGNLAGVFPQEPDEDFRHRWSAQKEDARLVEPPAPANDADDHPAWVSLGLVTMTAIRDANNGLQSLEFKKLSRYYRQLFSNDALSRLVFGLAERVDESARVRILTHAGVDAGSRPQAANVHRQLPNALKVKVVNSRGEVPSDDLTWLKVRFEIQSADGGKLSTTPFDDHKPYDQDQPNAGAALDVEVDPQSGLSYDLHWRFHKTPGPHVVSARIIPANADDPPFHPGSQILLHAVAKPTAPTIVGMELLDWHTPVRDGCVRWRKGDAKLRIFFSRKMSEDALKDDPQTGSPTWLKVWRAYSGACNPHHADQVTGPEPVKAEFLHLRSVGHTDDDFGAWSADYKLGTLLDDLHDHFTLRMLVAIRPTDDLKSVALGAADDLDPETYFPDEQTLDAEHAGSFLNAANRRELWERDELLGQPSHHHVWERFQLRETPWPSGRGAEGGDFPREFHKTFEFRLPRGS